MLGRDVSAVFVVLLVTLLSQKRVGGEQVAQSARFGQL
jgi:hypothetical protein